MKAPLESPEALEAYGMIDLCYLEIRRISEKLSPPRNPIAVMIDEATGYSEAKTQEAIKKTIELLEQVIESKKFLEADYSADLKYLDQIKNMTNAAP